MNEVAFVERRSKDWRLLNQLSDRAENSLGKLKVEEFREFVRVYRRVSADLALVRTKSDNIELITFLNDLVARSYSILYRAPRRRLNRVLADAVLLSARTVRKLRWFVAITVGLFFGSIGFGYFALKVNHDVLDVIVPPMFQESFEKWKSGEFEQRSGIESMGATGFYSMNNPVVALKTGAEAVGTFGISAVMSIYSNGLIMGALLYEVGTVGKSGHLIVSIAPHGVTEISGILLSGAAGLSMGWALICPGRRKRGEALAHAGKDALVVLVTAILMMYIAAPIEGFFSFNPSIPNAYKAGFAILSALAWGAFWVGYGRKNEGESEFIDE